MRNLNADTMGMIHLGSINWLAKGMTASERANRVSIVTDVIDILRLGLTTLHEN